jgi:hypothetical protein
MKKGIIVTAAILSFFIVTINSSAEMKITPGGITSPDDYATLRLRRPVNTGDYVSSPDGAVISGVNTYTGAYQSSGGYFSSTAFSGKGVYAEATGYIGSGVYGRASGLSGKGVFAEATGRIGKGVYGWASYTGANPQTYGGYFRADGFECTGVYGTAGGQEGVGVFGEATGGSSIGVRALCSSSYGYGLLAEATGTNATAIVAEATGGLAKSVWAIASGSTGMAVYADGEYYDFYAAGPGINYGSFTGAHEVKFAGDMPEEIVPGMIVSVTGKAETRKDKIGEISLSSTLPTVTISTRARDKAVFGVIVFNGPLPEDHWYETQEGERFGVVNALGEGRVWVTDFNGQVQAGDYITTSFVQGYGQLQDDDLLHSYTLGKAIETIDWEQATETVQYDGKTYKRYLIAVVYTSG